jgi:hypothetical protein
MRQPRATVWQNNQEFMPAAQFTVHLDLLLEMNRIRIQRSGGLVQAGRRHHCKSVFQFGNNLLVVGDQLTVPSATLPGFHIVDDVAEHSNLLLKFDAVTP